MARYVRPVPLWMRIGCGILGIALMLLTLATVIVVIYTITPAPRVTSDEVMPADQDEHRGPICLRYRICRD